MWLRKYEEWCIALDAGDEWESFASLVVPRYFGAACVLVQDDDNRLDLWFVASCEPGKVQGLVTSGESAIVVVILIDDVNE